MLKEDLQDVFIGAMYQSSLAYMRASSEDLDEAECIEEAANTMRDLEEELVCDFRQIAREKLERCEGEIEGLSDFISSGRAKEYWRETFSNSAELELSADTPTTILCLLMTVLGTALAIIVKVPSLKVIFTIVAILSLVLIFSMAVLAAFERKKNAKERDRRINNLVNEHLKHDNKRLSDYRFQAAVLTKYLEIEASE
ncbi:hypothetical protein IKF40_00730 [Candidatus Saccharibacteria bacterium]|nr:hypothetical protein [Candidatus Saccharibacteria bacterium]MBR2989444.1 hypothetical protein [Candidatus Saccharibacteria bacterium]